MATLDQATTLAKAICVIAQTQRTFANLACTQQGPLTASQLVTIGLSTQTSAQAQTAVETAFSLADGDIQAAIASGTF